MKLKSMILRGVENFIVVSPFENHRRTCKKHGIKYYSKLDNIRGLSNYTILVHSCFSEDVKYYIYGNNRFSIFEGEL